MSERTFFQLVATVVINEINPRVKRNNGLRPPPLFVRALVILEHNKLLTRKQVRGFLDSWYQEATA